MVVSRALRTGFGDDMAAEVSETGFRIVLISLADGRTDRLPVGAYLASYDPEGDGGNGVATWTRDPSQAMTFASGKAATACYRTIPWSEIAGFQVRGLDAQQLVAGEPADVAGPRLPAGGRSLRPEPVRRVVPRSAVAGGPSEYCRTQDAWPGRPAPAPWSPVKRATTTSLMTSASSSSGGRTTAGWRIQRRSADA
jgi:hypothetical protein